MTKYVIIIPDGCADEPQAALDSRTPLQAANVPNMDAIASDGIVGTTNNVPRKFTPGSEVAIPFQGEAAQPLRVIYRSFPDLSRLAPRASIGHS